MLNLDLPTLITRILTLLIAFSVHEFSHAWVANSLGDDTPRSMGRLTLNPLAHLDVMGSLLLLVAGFGWAKPVPINPYALRRRSPSALMWVSLAGPASNFVLAMLAAIPLRAGLIPYSQPGKLLPTPFSFLIEFIAINLLLMLFNLLPIAPLDGDKIAEYFLPSSWANTLERIRPYGPIILMVLLFGLPLVGLDVIGRVITPVQNTLLRLLIGV